MERATTQAPLALTSIGCCRANLSVRQLKSMVLPLEVCSSWQLQGGADCFHRSQQRLMTKLIWRLSFLHRERSAHCKKCHTSFSLQMCFGVSSKCAAAVAVVSLLLSQHFSMSTFRIGGLNFWFLLWWKGCISSRKTDCVY